MKYPSIYNILATTLVMFAASCTDEVENSAVEGGADYQPIRIETLDVGAPDISVSLPTRAEIALNGKVYPAESFKWLIRPLKGGLNITYGYAEGSDSHERVAKLQLQGGTPTDYVYSYEMDDGKKIAYYTFTYLMDGLANEGQPARWYGNGMHYFQGLNVPEKLVGDDCPITLVTDQHDDHASDDGSDDGNYTLLERYLGMPATTRLSATVSRVLLPFRHRLSRVLAYVLIDPKMGDNVTIKGFTPGLDANNKPLENPETTSFRFCNVKVLDKVIETDGKQQPQWTVARKAIPHFLGMRGSYKTSNEPATTEPEVKEHFYVYTDLSDKTKIYPANDSWQDAHKAYQDSLVNHPDNPEISGYSRMDYGVVPCYDLIVRPTYTDRENIMYDEAFYGNSAQMSAVVNEKNSIDFELTLSNDLIYHKSFTFDLDPNYETIVYLRVDREGVDYNTSGAELWDNVSRDDNYYGVNNSNGNTLSESGSSWQRAYRATDLNEHVTDGHYYYYDSENHGQYLKSDELWIKFFSQATIDGEHHGDYFILDHDITIPADKLPEDFVFTGHLDAQDHVITITGRGALFQGLDAMYDTPQETNADYSGDFVANVHKENSYWVPFKGWRAEVLNTRVKGGKLFDSYPSAEVTGNVYNCFDAWISETNNNRVADQTPQLPRY